MIFFVIMKNMTLSYSIKKIKITWLSRHLTRMFGSMFPPQKKVAIHNLKFGVRYLKFRVNQSKFQGSNSKFWVSSPNQEYLCKYINSLLLEALDASCPTIWHDLLEGIQSWRTWCWLSHGCYTLVAHSCWWYYLILSMHASVPSASV